MLNFSLPCPFNPPIKKILEKTPINDHFSRFYSETAQICDQFSEKLFIGAFGFSMKLKKVNTSQKNIIPIIINSFISSRLRT